MNRAVPQATPASPTAHAPNAYGFCLCPECSHRQHIATMKVQARMARLHAIHDPKNRDWLLSRAADLEAKANA